MKMLSVFRIEIQLSGGTKHSAVLKHMDLRNMDVFRLCASAQFARDHIWVTCKLLTEIFGRRMWSEEEAIAIC